MPHISHRNPSQGEIDELDCDGRLRGSTRARKPRRWQTRPKCSLGRISVGPLPSYVRSLSINLRLLNTLRSIATRHQIVPPWNNPTTLVATGGCIVLSIPHSIIPPAPATIPQQMAIIMRHLKGQYDKWSKERVKHFPLLEVARCTPFVARGYSTERFSGDPDAEITNLGVVDNKMKMVYEDDREELLRVEDFYVGLRRSTPIL